MATVGKRKITRSRPLLLTYLHREKVIHTSQDITNVKLIVRPKILYNLLGFRLYWFKIIVKNIKINKNSKTSI